jgi:hypothetical protein
VSTRIEVRRHHPHLVLAAAAIGEEAATVEEGSGVGPRPRRAVSSSFSRAIYAIFSSRSARIKTGECFMAAAMVQLRTTCVERRGS